MMSKKDNKKQQSKKETNDIDKTSVVTGINSIGLLGLFYATRTNSSKCDENTEDIQSVRENVNLLNIMFKSFMFESKTSNEMANSEIERLKKRISKLEDSIVSIVEKNERNEELNKCNFFDDFNEYTDEDFFSEMNTEHINDHTKSDYSSVQTYDLQHNNSHSLYNTTQNKFNKQQFLNAKREYEKPKTVEYYEDEDDESQNESEITPLTKYSHNLNLTEKTNISQY